MKKLTKITPFVIGFAPILVFAATLVDTIDTLRSLVNSIVPLLMVLAVAVFLLGIVKYITAGGNPEKEKAARGYIIYGLIGIFVLVAFWGIIALIANTFGVSTGGSPQLPSVTPGKVQ